MNLPTTRRMARIALCMAALAGSAATLAAPPDRLDQRLERMTQELKLTPEQQARIRTIVQEERAALERQRQDTRQRIDAVLTDAQRADKDRLMDRRLDRRVDGMAKRLDLDAAQTEQVRAILKERRTNPALGPTEVKERISAVLNDDQRKRLDAMADRRRPKDCGPGPRL